ncbi:MAG TPA: M12 family metallo-peptidase [Lysobacter sp.]
MTHCLRFLIVAAALALSGPVLAGKPLFRGESVPASRAASKAVAAIAGKPDTFSVKVMKADPGVVAIATREIELELGTRRVNLVQEKAHGTASGSLVWIGHVRETASKRPNTNRETRHDALNSAILVRRGNGVTGNIRMDGKLFRIQPLPDGNHAVVEVDESRRPPDHPPSSGMLQQIRHEPSRVVSAMTEPGATANIRVMVVATNQAIAAYEGDMSALVELAVAESNQGYANSNIGITMELAGYYPTDYVESGSFDTDLSRFQATADGHLDGFHATRDSIAADVNVLITDNTQYCGLGYLHSTASTAFSVVYHGCATGYYSFAHEIGHNQGAHHDPAAGSNDLYPYGHGYRAPDNTWRTIMAYNCSPSCPRVNYWSNPDVTYNGVPMGNTNQSHNQRVLIETKATVAAFRAAPPSNALSNGVAVTGLSGAIGSTQAWTMFVPAGASNLKFVTSGGTGDADLYVKFGSAPTLGSYDCKSAGGTNAETCNIPVAQAGTYHVMLRGYSAYAGLGLTGSFATGGSTQTYGNATDFTIGDNATVDSPITVGGRSGNAPTNASINVSILHTYKGDLKVDLVAPDGTLYNLHNRTGASTDNVVGTFVRDLSSEPLNGTWKLRVNDNASGDVGKIDSWSITF